jgi:pimeloyl-ACP methyl ester carboxylesterase
MPEGIVEINNQTKLFCLDEGEGESVVFVHGIGEDFRAWSRQVEIFASKHFRAIAYSRRFSTPNENAGDIHADTVVNNTEDLAGLIKTLGIAPVHLVGHSYGGSIAAYFAYKYPGLLRSLTLVEPALSSVFITNPNNLSARFALLFAHPTAALALLSYARTTVNPSIKALRRGDLAGATKSLVDGVQAKRGAFEQFPEDFRRMAVENASSIYAFENFGLDFGKDKIAEIKIPTLIIRGGTSCKISRLISDSLSKIIPNSEILVIPTSGHVVQYESPVALNERVLSFLGTQPVRNFEHNFP